MWLLQSWSRYQTLYSGNEIRNKQNFFFHYFIIILNFREICIIIRLVQISFFFYACISFQINQATKNIRILFFIPTMVINTTFLFTIIASGETVITSIEVLLIELTLVSILLIFSWAIIFPSTMMLFVSSIGALLRWAFD